MIVILRCNDICKYLKLPKFALHESEKNAQSRKAIEKSITSLTRVLSEVTNAVIIGVQPLLPNPGKPIQKFFRVRPYNTKLSSIYFAEKLKIQKRIAMRKRNVSSESCDSGRYSQHSFLESIRHRIRLLL